MKVLCIILGILLGLCLIGAGIVYLYFRREVKRWKNTAADNLRAGKEEAADGYFLGNYSRGLYHGRDNQSSR